VYIRVGVAYLMSVDNVAKLPITYTGKLPAAVDGGGDLRAKMKRVQKAARKREGQRQKKSQKRGAARASIGDAPKDSGPDMEDPDAWKHKIADPHWKQGIADAKKRYEAEMAARQAQAAIKKKEESDRLKAVKPVAVPARTKRGRGMFGRFVQSELGEPHALARMRGLLCDV
jgi:hypothetical protein